MRRFIAVLAVLALFCSMPEARAEKVDLSPENLLKTATHVVVGEVVQIYTRKENTANREITHYVAEVRVKKAEKGEGLKEEGLIYVRYFTKRWTGSGMMPPDTNGHRGLPEVGTTLRIYLACNAYNGFGETKDGGFDVIGANGFERLP
ncbi:MAG: hypothetical protein AB7F75_05605 [Planctomycetota bacterium]